MKRAGNIIHLARQSTACEALSLRTLHTTPPVLQPKGKSGTGVDAAEDPKQGGNNFFGVGS